MGGSASKGGETEEAPAPETEPETSQFWSIVPRQYDELVRAIIRPPRADYNVARLGPRRFNFCSRTFVRNDSVLVNTRGLALRCSHWQPHGVDRVAQKLPCVVFLHGNSSSRLEALNQLPVCLGMGMTLFAFDFAGSGKSEGKYVSLGWWEKEDLRVIIEHLREGGTTSSIALWGRSMGAVTALLYQIYDKPPPPPPVRNECCPVDALVLDSPFSDFCKLAQELVSRGQQQANVVMLPSFVTRLVLSLIGGTIRSVANFDVNDLNPIAHVRQCAKPALFVCARYDDFVGPHHVSALYEKYGGPKDIVHEDGDHNTARSIDTQLAAAAFLRRVLNVPSSWTLIPTNPKVATLYLQIPWEPYNRSRTNSHSEPTTPRGKRSGKNNASEPGESRETMKKALYYCNRGNALEEEGNVDAAIRAYRAAIAFEDSFSDAHYNLGIALKNKGELDDAIREYKRTIELKSDHADAYNNLGVALEEQGRVEAAITEYTKAIDFEPDHAEARCNLADLLQSLGRIDDAISHYRKALSARPNDSDAWNNLGVALEASGSIDDAIAAYTKAVDIFPSHWDAQANLAEALHVNGDLKTAATVYRVILDHDPRDAQTAASLGNVLHALGQVDDALSAYEIAVKNDPSDAVTHNNMGTVLQAKGDSARAADAYRSAIEHDASYAMAYFNLGVNLQSSGLLVEAIDAYRNATRLKPSYSDALNNLGYALQSTGDYAGAIDAYRQALVANPNFDSARLNLQQALSKLADGGDIDASDVDVALVQNTSSSHPAKKTTTNSDIVEGPETTTMPPEKGESGGDDTEQSPSSVQEVTVEFDAEYVPVRINRSFSESADQEGAWSSTPTMASEKSGIIDSLSCWFNNITTTKR
ncbi:hypothetical protein CTAYLR_004376 [Chrysophaeum taylorii]|uniref:Serine aminopeptidase S33 domain-containing protein n=1 Tax=Chrysophaeum taylorii TaxID=2483200 RepID=A0AAD7XTG6_9STRA|nr:hypothetical protein CTAYLR_004376 [Chrysophaeum taylorii]